MESFIAKWVLPVGRPGHHPGSLGGAAMEFEVTVRLPEAAVGTQSPLPHCRDAVLEHGRAGFVVATFAKDGENQGFEVMCALTDLRYALPDGVVTRIEFHS
jgi:hypothetical protein